MKKVLLLGRERDVLLVVLGVILLVVVGIAGAVAFSLMPRTEYVPGFSERAFSELKRGQATASEAIAALGEPFSTRNDRTASGEEHTTMFFSRPKAGYENYKVEALVFDKTGRLVEKVETVHAD
jgi:hypothetical protein